MCNRTFEDKDPNEAMEYLDLLAENAQNRDTTYEAPSKLNLIHLVEECTNLGKIMTSKPTLYTLALGIRHQSFDRVILINAYNSLSYIA